MHLQMTNGQFCGMLLKSLAASCLTLRFSLVANHPVLLADDARHACLQLYGNPLEYLPELSPCTQLRSLSLANVRIMADALFSRWECTAVFLGGGPRGCAVVH